MEDIRENRALALQRQQLLFPGPGARPLHRRGLGPKNPSAGEAISQVLEQLKLIMSQPVKDKELEDAKSYFIGSFARKMDSMSKRAWLLSYVEVYGLGLDYPWKYPDLIQHLTPADIQKVAEKYLHPDKYLLVVVGKKAAMPSLTGAATGAKKEEKRMKKRSLTISLVVMWVALFLVSGAVAPGAGEAGSKPLTVTPLPNWPRRPAAPWSTLAPKKS